MFEYTNTTGKTPITELSVNNKLAIVLKPQQSKSNMTVRTQLDILLTICMTNYFPSLNKD